MAARTPAPPASPFSPRATLERVGHLLSRAILTLIYALLVTPIAVVYLFGADPLRIRRGGPSTWGPWRSRNDTIERARAQA